MDTIYLVKKFTDYTVRSERAYTTKEKAYKDARRVGNFLEKNFWIKCDNLPLRGCEIERICFVNRFHESVYVTVSEVKIKS